MVDKKFYRIILLAFFLSGLAALVYEVVWARKLGLIFGTTTYAISTVLAVFFTGLALGSFIFGRLVDKYQRPLLIYALLELGIGIYAFFTPQIFELIKSLQISFWQRFTPTYSGFSLFTFLLSTAGLIIPTTLMGGTLPAISKFFVTQKEILGGRVSLLYAVNTAGAVLGTILAGFFLIILLGVNGAIYFAAVINILIGIGVLLLNFQFPISNFQFQNPKLQVTQSRSSPTTYSWPILIAYAMSGFAALALEVLWTRVLVMILGSSTYAFSIMLVTFLFGIALGSAIISKFVDKKENVLPYFVVTQVLIGLFVILSIPAFDRLPLLFLEILARVKEQFWGLQLAEFLFCSLIMLIPTLLMGAAFPVVVKVYKASGSHLRPFGSAQGFGGQVGVRVGEVYGANTVGGVFGSIAAGFLLIPLFGLQKSILVAGLVYLVVGVVILFLLPARRKVKFLTLVGVLTVFSLGILVRPWDKNILSSGVFIYGDLYLKPQATEILFYQEGLSSTVAVRRDPKDEALFLQINGKTDASSKGDLPTELLLGHLPMILHPNPQEVLVIGLGSGITLGALEQYKELKTVEAVEIEPAVVEAAKLFSPHHHNALDDPRLKMVIADARNYLLATDKKYDVITAEPSNLWIAGMNNLFTEEYFKIMRRKLKEGGIVLQWVHLYSLGERDLKTVIQTFQSVFPKTTVWTTSVGMEDLLLIGFNEEFNFNQIKYKFGQEKVREDLGRIKINKPTSLFSYFLLDSQAASKFAAGVPLNTDNHPILEFSTPKSFYAQTIGSNLASLADFQSLPTQILTNVDLGEESNLDREFEIRKNLIEAEIRFGEEKYQETASFLEKALTLDSSREDIKERLTDVYLEIGKGLFKEGKNKEAAEQFEKIIALEPENAFAYTFLAEVHIKKGEISEAEELLKKAILLDASLATTHMDLGIVYGEKKEFDKAEEELKKAIELDPTSFEAHNNLAHLYNLQIRRDLALEHWQASLKINPQQPEIRQMVEYVEKLKRLR